MHKLSTFVILLGGQRTSVASLVVCHIYPKCLYLRTQFSAFDN